MKKLLAIFTLAVAVGVLGGSQLLGPNDVAVYDVPEPMGVVNALAYDVPEPMSVKKDLI